MRLYRAALFARVIFELPAGGVECLADCLRQLLVGLMIHNQFLAGDGQSNSDEERPAPRGDA